MKKILLLSLLAVAVLFIAACAPGKAVAGQAYGGGCSPVLQNVKSCTDAGTSVSGEKQNGQSFSYTDSCVSGNKKLREHTCQTVSSSCPANMPAGQTCPPPSTMVVRCTTSCPSNQCDSNTKQCVAPLPVCGNNVKEGTEACDGTDLGDSALATCNAQMRDITATGTVQCAADCLNFDLSGCEAGEESEISSDIAQVMPPVTPPAASNVQVDGAATTVTTTAQPTGDGQIEVVVIAGQTPLVSTVVPGTASSVDLSGVSVQTAGSKIVATGLTGAHYLYPADTAHTGIRLCPSATSLAQVTGTCSGGKTVSYADCEASLNDCHLMGGQGNSWYYKVRVSGSGAFEVPAELCFDGIDNNFDGQYGEGCAPYTCTDEGGIVTETSVNGQSRTSPDVCTTGKLNQSSCMAATGNWLSLLKYSGVNELVTCTNTCTDPEGPTPAVCS